jgi:hypothetical protein
MILRETRYRTFPHGCCRYPTTITIIRAQAWAKWKIASRHSFQRHCRRDQNRSRFRQCIRGGAGKLTRAPAEQASVRISRRPTTLNPDGKQHVAAVVSAGAKLTHPPVRYSQKGGPHVGGGGHSGDDLGLKDDHSGPSLNSPCWRLTRKLLDLLPIKTDFTHQRDGGAVEAKPAANVYLRCKAG